jgi:bacteriocin-like protein
MTGNTIKAKSEALELHELSSKELDAVSGGRVVNEDAYIAERMRVVAQALAGA